MVTMCLSQDLKESGILVTGLHPGWVQTEIGGPNAWIDTKQSVEGMMKVMASLNEDKMAKMITFEGEILPW